MIGIKVTIKDQDDIHEVLSEPYVATYGNSNAINSKTFVTVVNLKTNKITETSIYNIDELVSETQYKNQTQS